MAPPTYCLDLLPNSRDLDGRELLPVASIWALSATSASSPAHTTSLVRNWLSNHRNNSRSVRCLLHTAPTSNTHVRPVARTQHPATLHHTITQSHNTTHWATLIGTRTPVFAQCRQLLHQWPWWKETQTWRRPSLICMAHSGVQPLVQCSRAPLALCLWQVPLS